MLIGYEPNLRVFAGFDLARHRKFSGKSNSVQVDVGTLQRALQDGIAFHRKSNAEIAIGIRPDQFVNYACNAKQLHKDGAEAVTFGLLEKASALDPISEGDLRNLTPQRRRIVQTVSRLSRTANFRKTVLAAYDHRCAVTRMQLRLVEAAHILPIGEPESIDDVRNGIVQPLFCK